MKPLMMPLLALVSAVYVSGATTVRANTVDADHVSSPISIVVEHAEILLSTAKDDYAEGYLTIWNGTQTQANLTGISSDVFDSSEFYRNTFGTLEAIQGGVFIPGHAELKMSGSGVHLVLKEPKLPFDQIEVVTLSLEFADGTGFSIPARIISSDEDLTDHHHGEGDTAYRQR